MTNPLLIVQTNPVPGREAEFDEWYTTKHLADVLAVPGFLSAQRYRMSPIQRDEVQAAYRYRHVALYELDGDPRAALHNLGAAVRGGLQLSEALDSDRTLVVYDPVTDRVTR